MPFFSLSPQGRGNRSMPLFSLSHWREGTVRCRFYSLLRSASLPLPLERGNRPMPFLFTAPARFLPLPLERGNRSMSFLFTAPARFSPSPTGEREPSDAVFIHCSGPLFSLSHWGEGTVRCRFYSLLRPAFLPLPSGEGRGEGSSHTAGNRPIKLRFCRGCDIISSSFSTQAK